MSTAFEAALEALSRSRSRGWRLGLDRMTEYLRQLGLDRALGPPTGPAFFHVAGTNGKGSTTAFVESVLRSQGHATGAAFSPYVYHVTERVQLGGRPISESVFARLVERLVPVADAMEDSLLGAPTEFEIKTALGFAAWDEAKCTAVALEVGLGGRLDATNVVDPVCSVIVSIALDHTRHLGDSISAIAREKAGIMKPGRPAIVGEVSPEAWSSIARVAKETGSDMWRFGQDVNVTVSPEGFRLTSPLGEVGPFRPGIEGVSMPHNAGLALAAVLRAGMLEDSEAACHAIGMTALPGRLERRDWGGAPLVLDGAHNAHAAESLAATLAPEAPFSLVVGMMDGHDARSFLAALSELSREVHFVPIDWYRALAPEALIDEAQGLFERTMSHDSVLSGISAARESGHPILVTGSFYLVGEVGRMLDAFAERTG